MSGAEDVESRHREETDMRRTVWQAIGALVGTAATVVAVGMPAGAATEPAGPAAAKQAAHVAIERRVASLNTAVGLVESSTFLGVDQVTLVHLMQSDVSGLQQLDQTIQADTTLQAVRADARKIFTDYRVYALVLPVVHMVRGADAITNVIVPKLDAAASHLQDAITQQNRSNLQPLLDDLKTQTAGAQQLAGGLPGKLEALKPADWNANHAVLQPSRDTLQSARIDLRQARQDARDIVSGLAT
jgi:hypothetical protein